MKKSYYLFEEEIDKDIYLYYNTAYNTFLLLNKEKHIRFDKDDLNNIKNIDPLFYQKLKDNHFIISDETTEYESIAYLKKKMLFDSSMYQIVINTTLDCNLDCWYCYENRVSGSKLHDNIIEAIKKNINLEFDSSAFNTLKISFFGGEPFLHFEGIQEVLLYAKTFCKTKGVTLIADFTTNATLISQKHINFLRDYTCHFQITIDGDRETHNTIKKEKLHPTDTYQKTLDALRLINDQIKHHVIAVRVNFDNRTLQNIDNIINDLIFLNREDTYVILKKVWQIPTDKVNKPLLLEAIQKFLDNDFLLDYYVMPKGCVCFAERHRQVLFNYDGKIFKCTTISSFNNKNSLGSLDINTGGIHWDNNKMAAWMKDIQPEQCIQCKWYPACLGICNRQLMAHPKEKLCTFDAMNLTQKEYLMYIFKYNLLKNKLNKIEITKE